jgi:hypothetical protein
MKTIQKASVTERALFQRVDRKLKQQDNPEQLRTARTEQQREQLGRYFVVEAATRSTPKKAASQGVVYTDVDLEKLARKLGVLEPWEQLEGSK